MVAQGGTSISKVAVVTADGGFPCGVCLQVLLEFNHTEDQMQVALVGNEAIKLYSFADLLPRGFSSFQNGSLRNPTTL
jgi:cytidine deaminase